MGKAYTGVDIGGGNVQLAVCDEGAVHDLVVEPLPEGLMADGRIVSFDAMADFLKELAHRSGGIARDVAFVLPEADSFVRRISMPAMSEKELLLNLPYEFRDYISQGKDHYRYDYAVLNIENTPDGTPETMDILAAAAAKSTIAEYGDMFRRAGLRLRVALPAAAALQNLMGGNPNARANCCLMRFAQTGTALYFFRNGTYDVTRSIDVGGVDMVHAVAGAFGVDDHMAAHYLDTNYQGAQDHPAVLDVYERVAVEIGRALNFYGFNNADVALNTVYYSGYGAQIPSLLAAVESHVSAEIVPVDAVLPPVTRNPQLAIMCPVAIGATQKAR